MEELEVKKVEMTEEQIKKMEYLYKKQQQIEEREKEEWKERIEVLKRFRDELKESLNETTEELDDPWPEQSRVYKNWNGHRVNLLGSNNSLSYNPFSERKTLSVEPKQKPKKIEYQREVNIVPEPEIKPLIDNSRFLKKHYESMQIKNNQRKYRKWINRRDVLFARILRLILNYFKSIFGKIFKHNIEEFKVMR